MNAPLSWQQLADRIDRSRALNGRAFAASTPFAPPAGRWRQAVHYGAMLPGLPTPIRFLDVIVVLGQAGVRAFDNPDLLVTEPDDAAFLLTGTGARPDRDRTAGLLSPLSVAGDCDLEPDHLRFGRGDDSLTIAGRYPTFTVAGHHRGVALDLEARTTDNVAHFAHLPGVYDHWSLLTRFRGTIEHAGQRVELDDALGTWEYARASRVSRRDGHFRQRHPLPIGFFTYQILNVDRDTQVLLVEVLGPRGLPVQRRVYVRSTDGRRQVLSRGFSYEVHAEAPAPLVTPDGFAMRMPSRFSWRVEDDHGDELIAVEGRTHDDFVYGMAAGYAGSYAYAGHYRGRPIEGDAYIEHIDRRPR